MTEYIIKFTNKIPTWESLSGTNESYPKLNIMMKVYKKDKLDFSAIYSIKLEIDGHYYCCGSKNFEFDKVKKTIIKECDDKLLNDIYFELQNSYRNIFKDTVLDIWITRIFEQLCEY